MWRKTPEATPSSSDAVLGSPDKPRGGRSNATESNSIASSVQTAQTSTSYLPAGLKLKGALSGRSDLTIDTKFEGTIELPDSSVRIGPNGDVQSGITAREIAVQGSIAGNLKAEDSIALEQGSSVRGDLIARRIRIDDGASFRGSVEMDEAKRELTPATSITAPSIPSQQPNQSEPSQAQQRSAEPRNVERAVAAKAKAAK